MCPNKTLGLNTLLPFFFFCFFFFAFNVRFPGEDWPSALLVAITRWAAALLPGTQVGSGCERGCVHGGGREVTTVCAFLNTWAGGKLSEQYPGISQRSP